MLDLLAKINGIFDRRTKGKLVVATFGSFVVALLDTVAVSLVLPLVDLATQHDQSHMVQRISAVLGSPASDRLLVILTASVVGLFILKDVASMVFIWWVTGFVFTERVRTSARLLNHVLVTPYTQASQRSSAELMRTVDGAVMQVFNFTVSGIMYAVSNALSIAMIVIALFLISPLATLILIVYFAMGALAYLKIIRPRAQKAGRVMNEASVAGWRAAFAALGAIKELNLRGTQEHFVRRYESAQLRGALAGRSAAFFSSLPKYLLEILFIVAIGIVLMVSRANQQLGGAGGALGLLALFVAAGFRVLPSVTGLLANVSNVRVGADSLDIVHAEWLAASKEPLASEITVEQPLELRDALSLQNVSFIYPGSDRRVLTDVNLQVPRGASVALVGGSGAGKTTLVDLILGLHTPTSGSLQVDGVDIGAKKRSWQAGCGYVAQDIFILDATLAENVAFDQEAATIEPKRVWRALQEAQLSDFAASLPEGIGTQLGERGARLSGGERQRIGIARALYRQPQLLVLDEATSALDNDTEHRIGRTIRALRGSVTVIIVAHRLSTVRHVDRLIFMDRGRVEAVGTFDELRSTSPAFGRLVELGGLEDDDTEDHAPDDEGTPLPLSGRD